MPHHPTPPDMEAVAALIGRLSIEPGICAFCGNDPYHYVDNGVGMERVAVTCCDEGIALYQHGDEVLQRQVTLRAEAAEQLETLLSERRQLIEALEKIGSLQIDGPRTVQGLTAFARAALTGRKS